jgi:hypothetical protein
MMETAFTRLVGCSVPLQQAGFAGAATPELAGAVADAGGLGMVGMSAVPPGEVAATLAALNTVRAGRVGMNFLVPFLDDAVVEAAAPHVRVVEFFYGDPDRGSIGDHGVSQHTELPTNGGRASSPDPDRAPVAHPLDIQPLPPCRPRLKASEPVNTIPNRKKAEGLSSRPPCQRLELGCSGLTHHVMPSAREVRTKTCWLTLQ